MASFLIAPALLRVSIRKSTRRKAAVVLRLAHRKPSCASAAFNTAGESMSNVAEQREQPGSYNSHEGRERYARDEAGQRQWPPE